MDIWLIVAVVVAVAVVVLLVVLTLRRRRNRRSVEKVGPGTEALAPVAVDTPLEPGAAQDRPDPAAPRA
ncbi:MAG TPA: hypothetical protein VNA11_05250, partial [Pseudonocardia sp.]|nr:hypothetical protein [Pseudonocardia sp.]